MSLTGLALALTLSVTLRAAGVEENPPPPGSILTTDPGLARARTRHTLARDEEAQLRGADLRAPRPELS